MVDPATAEQLSRDVEAFKSDIRQLQQDLSEMMSSAGNYSKEKLDESRQRIKAAMSQLKYQAGQKAADIYGAAYNQGAYAVDKSRRSIEQHPLASVAIAFGAGLLISWLSERTRE